MLLFQSRSRICHECGIAFINTVCYYYVVCGFPPLFLNVLDCSARVEWAAVFDGRQNCHASRANTVAPFYEAAFLTLLSSSNLSAPSARQIALCEPVIPCPETSVERKAIVRIH